MPTLVLGAGPVGCAAAIVLARRTKVTLGVRYNGGRSLERVDAVPLHMIAGLIELGLHPQDAGISDCHETILTAWEDRSPRALRGFPKVHVDRNRLDSALLALAERTPGVTLATEPALTAFDRIIDATGRRAFTAIKVHRPGPAWVARLYSFEGHFRPSQTGFRIAALPYGYAYRLGSAQRLTLGLVGPAAVLREGSGAFLMNMHRAGASWMLAGIPALDQTSAGAGGACSLQWTEPSCARPLGDALLAPDILAAQGLARGLAEALALSDWSAQTQDIRDRVAMHCASLRQAVKRCVWRRSAVWSQYFDSLITDLTYPAFTE